MPIEASNLYPSLRELERKSLVTAWDETTGRGGRPRRYYRLTPSGRRMALSSLRTARTAVAQMTEGA
jgi:DNA-binding PadR family transcriptional regulator